MKKKKFEIPEGLIVIIFLLILISLVIGINLLIIKIDKDRCEKHGGTYVWEFTGYGSKCHLTNGDLNHGE